MTSTLNQQDLFVLAGLVLLAQLGWGLLSKIVWDWLKARNGVVKALKLEEAPVSFGDMQKHCDKAQDACQELVCGKMDGILERLKRGDLRFESQERRYQRLDRALVGIKNQLSEVIRSNGKAEKMSSLLEDIRQEIRAGKTEVGGG